MIVKRTPKYGLFMVALILSSDRAILLHLMLVRRSFSYLFQMIDSPLYAVVAEYDN